MEVVLKSMKRWISTLILYNIDYAMSVASFFYIILPPPGFLHPCPKQRLILAISGGYALHIV